MAIINNFYPPVIDTYMPAFVINNGAGICRVYFSISEYNSLSDIKNAQISIVNQYTNISVLDTTQYPSGIMLQAIKTDNTKTTNDKYYIEVKNTDLKGNNYEIDLYYKVQIRFTHEDADNISLNTPQKLDSWIAANLSYFSEWSSVCLIRGISQPTMGVKGFNIDDEGHIYWSTANSDLIGVLSFADEDETEVLRQYQIKLFKENGTLLTNSGILYPNNYNDINSFIYRFKYNFEPNQSYYFTIDYTTQNLYSGNTQINFTVVEDAITALDFSLSVSLDEEDSYIKLNLKRSQMTSFTGDVVIRRASSEDNFTLWDDLFRESFTGVTNVKKEFKDTTIKSGVWYKYYIQKIENNGNRGQASKPSKPLMTIFEDMFLTTKKRQLRLQFDPSISSFKQNISDSLIETIGSKYPYIRRNGAVNYAQFPIGGLISFLMDPNEMFISQEEIYGEQQKSYEKYNETNKINEYKDFVYEKAFRDAVQDFLYADDVKLFRSSTEGNHLIRLTDVSFTPKPELGRMIWSFAATATEIDDDTIDNYELYNIIPERG